MSLYQRNAICTWNVYNECNCYILELKKNGISDWLTCNSGWQVELWFFSWVIRQVLIVVTLELIFQCIGNKSDYIFPIYFAIQVTFYLQWRTMTCVNVTADSQRYGRRWIRRCRSVTFFFSYTKNQTYWWHIYAWKLQTRLLRLYLLTYSMWIVFLNIGIS